MRVGLTGYLVKVPDTLTELANLKRKIFFLSYTNDSVSHWTSRGGLTPERARKIAVTHSRRAQLSPVARNCISALKVSQYRDHQCLDKEGQSF